MWLLPLIFLKIPLVSITTNVHVINSKIFLSISAHIPAILLTWLSPSELDPLLHSVLLPSVPHRLFALPVLCMGIPQPSRSRLWKEKMLTTMLECLFFTMLYNLLMLYCFHPLVHSNLIKCHFKEPHIWLTEKTWNKAKNIITNQWKFVTWIKIMGPSTNCMVYKFWSYAFGIFKEQWKWNRLHLNSSCD